MVYFNRLRPGRVGHRGRSVLLRIFRRRVFRRRPITTRVRAGAFRAHRRATTVRRVFLRRLLFTTGATSQRARGFPLAQPCAIPLISRTGPGFPEIGQQPSMRRLPRGRQRGWRLAAHPGVALKRSITTTAGSGSSPVTARTGAATGTKAAIIGGTDAVAIFGTTSG